MLTVLLFLAKAGAVIGFLVLLGLAIFYGLLSFPKIYSGKRMKDIAYMKYFAVLTGISIGYLAGMITVLSMPQLDLHPWIAIIGLSVLGNIPWWILRYVLKSEGI